MADNPGTITAIAEKLNQTIEEGRKLDEQQAADRQRLNAQLDKLQEMVLAQMGEINKINNILQSTRPQVDTVAVVQQDIQGAQQVLPPIPVVQPVIQPITQTGQRVAAEKQAFKDWIASAPPLLGKIVFATIIIVIIMAIMSWMGPKKVTPPVQAHEIQVQKVSFEKAADLSWFREVPREEDYAVPVEEEPFIEEIVEDVPNVLVDGDVVVCSGETVTVTPIAVEVLPACSDGVCPLPALPVPAANVPQVPLVNPQPIQLQRRILFPRRQVNVVPTSQPAEVRTIYASQVQKAIPTSIHPLSAQPMVPALIGAGPGRADEGRVIYAPPPGSDVAATGIATRGGRAVVGFVGGGGTWDKADKVFEVHRHYTDILGRVFNLYYVSRDPNFSNVGQNIRYTNFEGFEDSLQRVLDGTAWIPDGDYDGPSDCSFSQSGGDRSTFFPADILNAMEGR